jgi:cell division protein FtsB
MYRPAPAGKPAARPVTSRPRPQVPRPQPGRLRPARAAEPGRASRTRFIFLVVGLLGGGLLCLLVINTILATGSFQITALKQSNITLAQQEQAMHAKIAAEESPFSIARQARKLGMVEPGLLHFLNLNTGRINSGPSQMPGIPTVPGYDP